MLAQAKGQYVTLTDMIQFYRSLTNQETNFHPDVSVINLINRGAMDFQRKVKILETSTIPPIDIVSGTASYPLPADFIETIRVELTTTTGFREEIFATKPETLTVETINWRQDTGQPTNYFMNAGNKQIVLYPEPDTSITAALNIEYKKIPNTLVIGSDVSLLPEEHHEVIVYRAVALGFLRDGDTTQYRLMNDLYREEVSISKILLSRRTTALRMRKRGHIVHTGRIALNLGPDSPRAL